MSRYWVDWYADAGVGIRRWHEGIRADALTFEQARAEIIEAQRARIEVAAARIGWVLRLTEAAPDAPFTLPPAPPPLYGIEDGS